MSRMVTLAIIYFALGLLIDLITIGRCIENNGVIERKISIDISTMAALFDAFMIMGLILWS